MLTYTNLTLTSDLSVKNIGHIRRFKISYFHSFHNEPEIFSSDFENWKKTTQESSWKPFLQDIFEENSINGICGNILLAHWED